MDFGFVLLMIGIFVLFGFIIIASIFSNIVNVAKWLGLGAIAGNAINNKINADAAVKSGKKFQKKKIETKNSLFQSVANFISPPTEEEVSEQVSDEDYEEFQEFLKWKKTKNDKT